VIRAQTTPTTPARVGPEPTTWSPGRIGQSDRRPDGVPKVKGEFEYSSDLWMDGMLWGAILRSPHPRANIWSIDTSAAEDMPGVYAVLTYKDVPGRKVYGMEIPDQPVLAWERIRYQGEPIAIVAADHPETARRALDKIGVDYDVLEPLTDSERAMQEDAPKVQPSGNVLRHARVRHGDPEAAEAQADVVVSGEYEIGMQDQAFLAGRRRPLHLDPVATRRPGPAR
jgi:CO/xanthine dehydrogenase Mo-binding subunit